MCQIGREDDAPVSGHEGAYIADLQGGLLLQPCHAVTIWTWDAINAKPATCLATIYARIHSDMIGAAGIAGVVGRGRAIVCYITMRFSFGSPGRKKWQPSTRAVWNKNKQPQK